MLHHQGTRRATVHGQSLSKETIQNPNHEQAEELAILQKAATYFAKRLK